MKPMRTLVTLALCTLLAAGCSAVSVIYNNAPSYLAGELEDAFDLDDAQSAELDRRMQEFFVWHRREELALYQQFLEEAALNAADGISAEEFLEFVRGSELIIHNAPFDVGFLDYELSRLDSVTEPLDEHCEILDTLLLARQKHPGQKNNLDALCKRYNIDNSHRSLHGALLDARILSDVYLITTGGQASLGLDAEVTEVQQESQVEVQRVVRDQPLPLWQPDATALAR